MNKRDARIRRARRLRGKIKQGAVRLTVHRTPMHIYAQVIKQQQGQSTVIACASTVDKEVKAMLKGNKTERAEIVGKILALRALKKGVKQIAFDRSGFKYHGRIKALAESAREAGMVF